MPALLDGASHLVVEGGGALARIWSDEARDRQIDVRHVTAEDWRGVFLYPREQRYQFGVTSAATGGSGTSGGWITYTVPAEPRSQTRSNWARS